FGDGSIGKVRLERWNEQTGLWDVSWKDKNGVIRIQKDISMEGYVPSVEAEKLIKDREKKSLDQKQKSGENQKNQQKLEKKEEVSTGKARMTEIDPASFPRGELSRDAQKLFNVKGMPQPRYKIEIDGQEFFVSKRGVGGKNRDCILGYVKVGYQYEPRLFYFSQSGGNWHCAPGVDRATKSKDLRFSKGEPLGLQYEKGTVVGRELDQIFSKLGEEGIDVSIMSTWEEQFGQLDPRDDLHKRYFQKFKDKYQHEFQSTKLYQNAGSFADLDEGLSFEGVKQKISSIPIDPKFDMNFRGGFRKGPDMHHQHLKHVKTIIGETNWNGKPIEVTFAHAADNPDLMWIENIVFRDSPLNSHGIPTQQVDGGLLTAKPLEYWNQVPKKIKNEGIVYGDYRDIRPYIQLNPLIVRFKQLQGYQKAA
ncbi:hypothetical protein KBD33_06550, partial [Candidatus Gracilibacteria bacterium]|nr:hypothetical protein [Candidatus Gracilibacteria bacterium]